MCPRPRMVDLNGLVEYTGMDKRYIRRLVAQQRIPYVKDVGKLHFELDDIDSWIEERRRPVKRSS